MSTSDSLSLDLPSAKVLQHIVDVHCHPTDAPGGVSDASMERLKITICAMSTMPSDQDKVRSLALRYPDKVVPCFGQFHLLLVGYVDIHILLESWHYTACFYF